MDYIPHVFVDYVAHLLPQYQESSLLRECLKVKFVDLASDVWNDVGQNHDKKRVDCELKVGVNNGVATSWRLNEFIHDMLAVDYRYGRIVSIELWEPRAFQNVITTELVQKLISRFQVEKLVVLNSNKFAKAPKFLWQFPVETLHLTSTCPLKILEFHLCCNEHLRVVAIESADYDYTRMLVESWKKREIQTLKPTRREWNSLSKLGFTLEQYDCYELHVSRTEENGLHRVIRFCALH
ncbi:hypothetical protein L596_009482 [Steinernema carpocapsae]|uniref:Uncharacterized protein n=1 Tax=Steinernema carpocapsae TaxID=34508 RepID=A0A4U5PG00_STECR|nr:hypothetical protein L596_009482 [Steinernema carpocapsae]